MLRTVEFSMFIFPRICTKIPSSSSKTNSIIVSALCIYMTTQYLTPTREILQTKNKTLMSTILHYIIYSLKCIFGETRKIFSCFTVWIINVAICYQINDFNTHCRELNFEHFKYTTIPYTVYFFRIITFCSA